MFRTSVSFTVRQLAAATVAAFALGITTLAPAAAQQVVARVNGDPVTAVDVAQRMRLIQASTQKAPSRQQVLDELIDEHLKLQTARRYRMEIPDSEVDTTLAAMAQRMGGNTETFTKALGQAGIGIAAMKRKIRADIAWQQIVRGKFQASLQVGDRDIHSVLQGNKADGKDSVAYEYTLHPILLIVPRGGGNAGIEARRREADGLRNRFQSCEEGLRLARGLQDVAVRPPMTRSSGELSAKLREVLESTPVGRLTPPDITPQGVEVFALCAKREAKGDTGRERDVREELFSAKFQAQGKKYLQELRRSAAIELR